MIMTAGLVSSQVSHFDQALVLITRSLMVFPQFLMYDGIKHGLFFLQIYRVNFC